MCRAFCVAMRCSVVAACLVARVASEVGFFLQFFAEIGSNGRGHSMCVARYTVVICTQLASAILMARAAAGRATVLVILYADVVCCRTRWYRELHVRCVTGVGVWFGSYVGVDICRRAR